MTVFSKGCLLADTCLALTLGIFSAPAAAQPAPQSPDAHPSATVPQDGATEPTTADIVVTAQFREQRLQDTPLSITAIGGATLEAREQRSVADLGRFAPNVNITTSGQFFGNAITAYIRGVGQSNSNFAYEPGVGMYIDDVYYGTTFGAVFDLTDLDHVEILRGPQGTLAGKNSVGGSVKLYTKKPNATDTGYVEATYGRFGRLDVRGSANFKVAEDLFIRVSGVSKNSDGYLDRLDYGCANPGGAIAPHPAGKSCKIGTDGGISLNALRVAARYQPTTDLEINLSADVARDRSDAVAVKLLAATGPRSRTYDAANPAGGVPYDNKFVTPAKSYTSYSTSCNGGNFTTLFGTTRQLPTSLCVPPRNNVDSYGFSGTLDYSLSDALSFKSITAYRNAEGDNGVDIDGSPIGVFQEFQTLEHSQFTQELRLSGKFDDLANFTVGGFYYDGKDRLQIHLEIPVVLFDFVSDDPVSNKSKSLFAHFELTPLPGLSVIGGIRHTNDKKTYTFSRRNLDGSPITGVPLTTNFLIAGLDGLSSTFKENRVDYRVGVNYRWADWLMTYAQVATGYKGGGINPTPNVADQVRPFSSEQVTAYEAGFKANPADGLITLNGAAFLNKYKGIQTILLSCPPSASPICSLPANAGDADVKGTEFEIFLRPVRGLTLQGNIGYLDFQYKRVNPVTRVTLGMKAAYNSEWQASGGVEYTADLGASGALVARADIAYLSSYYTVVPNTADALVPGRTTVDTRLTYETADKDWSLSVGVTNLFNKFYYNSIGRYADFGILSAVVARPREWSLTLKRRF